MPAFIDEQLARSLYKRHQPSTHLAGEPPQPTTPLTYGREFFQGRGRLQSRFQNRASGMTSLGVLTNHSVLVVGSAFGYLMAELDALGIETWGIEPGPWFWRSENDSEWEAGMKARTAQDWIGSGTEVDSFNAIGVSGQAKFNWIVDEDAAPAHSDAELPAFIAGLEARLQGNVKGRIVHIVTTMSNRGPGDSSQNWKSLADWQAVAPDHTWLDARNI